MARGWLVIESSGVELVSARYDRENAAVIILFGILHTQTSFTKISRKYPASGEHSSIRNTERTVVLGGEITMPAAMEAVRREFSNYKGNLTIEPPFSSLNL